jgi:hypothetical protein
VALLRAAEIRPPAAAPRAQPVAKRAVCPELRFAQLRRLRISSKRILVLRAERHSHCSTSNQHGAPEEER